MLYVHTLVESSTSTAKRAGSLVGDVCATQVCWHTLAVPAKLLDHSETVAYDCAKLVDQLWPVTAAYDCALLRACAAHNIRAMRPPICTPPSACQRVVSHEVRKLRQLMQPTCTCVQPRLGRKSHFQSWETSWYPSPATE